MKGLKLYFWCITLLICIFFLLSAYRELTLHPETALNNEQMGYPEYFLTILAIAKIIGIVVLLLPGFERLKEWVYACFVIDIIGVFWSELAVGHNPHSLKAVVAIVFLLASYLLLRKIYVRVIN